MVVFTCNHCGDSLAKPKVEKHYNFQCRTFKSLTCVDCHKDFKNEEYESHIKCMTEDERYAAKGTYVNGIVKKGEIKQETWINMIKSIINNEKDLKPNLKHLLESIGNYTNVPRKQKQFVNFIKNSMGGRVQQSNIEEVWNIINKYKQNKNVSLNGQMNTEVKENIKTEIIIDESIYENEEIRNKKPKIENTLPQIKENLDKFSFQGTIISILEKKSCISEEKLQKKVLKLYRKQTSKSVTEHTIKKYNKKLRKNPKIHIENGHISLIKI